MKQRRGVDLSAAVEFIKGREAPMDVNYIVILALVVGLAYIQFGQPLDNFIARLREGGWKRR